ncbi:MAG: hypothetical protein ACI83B_002805, partial [Sediminicola sp.]
NFAPLQIYHFRTASSSDFSIAPPLEMKKYYC